MKKVFLSLAVIATLTVVSCKDKAAEAPAETTVETEVVAPEVVVDTTAAAPVDTTAAAPATEAPAAK